MNKTNLLFGGVLLILLLGLLWSTHKWTALKDKNSNLIEDIYNKVIFYQSNDSIKNMRIEELESQNRKMSTLIQTKDSILKALQNAIKERKDISEKNPFGNPIQTITIRDTITKYLYPIYESELNGGKWAKGRFYADKDTTLFDIRFINDYEIIQREEKQGWFQPSVPIIEVKNLNPYTITTELKTYKVKVPNKRLGIGTHIGYGVSFKGELLPYVGIGLQYHLLQF